MDPKKWEIPTASREERRALYTSLTISLAIVIIGFVWSFMIGRSTLPLRHDLGHLDDTLEYYSKQHSTKAGDK